MSIHDAEVLLGARHAQVLAVDPFGGELPSKAISVVLDAERREAPTPSLADLKNC